MPDQTEPDEAPSVTERLTVGLIGDASRAMARVRSRTGMRKADIINRALVVYDFIDSESRAGRELLTRDENGELEKVRFL